jgi:hypothetical protein
MANSSIVMTMLKSKVAVMILHVYYFLLEPETVHNMTCEWLLTQKNIKNDQLNTSELVLRKPICIVTYNIFITTAMKISRLGCDGLQRGVYGPFIGKNQDEMQHIRLKNYDLSTYNLHNSNVDESQYYCHHVTL